MIDKQIKEGIDVSQCEFLIISNNEHLCRCIKSDLFGGIEFVENAKNRNCKDNPNCYYKQSKHKEQECEALGQAYLETNELLQEKTKECTNLKAYNEELKKANKHIEHNRNQKADKLMRIEKLITACQTGYTDEFIQKLLIILHEKEPNSFENKYKATLIEIKDIAKQCFGKDFCTGCKYCEQCYVKNGKISTYDVCKIILQKISECEVKND